jgi:hypothetical protein
MVILEHFVVFFLAGFTSYLLAEDRGNNFGVLMLIAIPMLGVYFLGWWALLSFFVGLMFGSNVWFKAHPEIFSNSDKNQG